MKSNQSSPEIVRATFIPNQGSLHDFLSSQTPLARRQIQNLVQSQQFPDQQMAQETTMAVKGYSNPLPGCSNMHLIASRRVRQGNTQKRRANGGKSSRQQTFLEVGKKRQIKQIKKIKGVIGLTDLLKMFHQKLTYNSVLRNPISFDPLENESEGDSQAQLCHIGKIVIPKMLENIFAVSKIIYIIVFCFAFPLSLLFSQVSEADAIIALKVVGIFLCFVDIFEILQSASGQQVGYVDQQQSKNRMSQQKLSLFMQIAVLISCVLSILLTEYRIKYSTIFFGAMAINVIKYQKCIVTLENQFLTATHYEKYADLAKILALNLFICHLVGCLLISITYMNLSQTWMTQAGIQNAPWYQQYIWSYYFGTTIILTIGFGDLHAANYIQAFFIITISFFACVFFGYNINYIGNLINSIRQDELQKKDKLKVFGSLAKKAQVPKELKSQITNYIIQQSEIKKISNYAQQKKLLQELPATLRSSFLQESNKRIFNHLFEMVKFTKGTIERLSENIQTKICHPGQPIKRAGSQACLMILQSGEVGYATRFKNASKLSNIVLERIKNSTQNQSKLICVDVLSGQPLNYDIKSLSYSVISYIDKETFQTSIRQSQQDFEFYRQMLDKCRYKINEFGVTLCKFCPNKKHTVFECPRLHFIPFRHTVPIQYYRKKPVERQERTKFMRTKKQCYFQVTEVFCTNDKSNLKTYDLEDLCHLNPHILKRRHPHQKQKNSSLLSSKKSGNVRAIQMISQIREELQNMKKDEPKLQFEFSLWANSDCDQAYNFNNYFPGDNSSSLSSKEKKASLQNISKSLRKKFQRKQTLAALSYV